MPLIKAVHIRRASENLNLNYAELGRVLGKSRSTISRWANETEQVVNPEMVGLSLAALYYRQGDEAAANELIALAMQEGEYVNAGAL